MTDQTSETVAVTFLAGWVARFWRSRHYRNRYRVDSLKVNFFSNLVELLGICKLRTTAYNPKANGAFERFHRQLKSSIKCHATEKWTEVLAIILLGIRSSYKEDILATIAEMVYGSPLRLPGEFFRESEPNIQQVDFLLLLKKHAKKLRPVPTSKHNVENVFIYKELNNCDIVFFSQDFVRRP